VFGGCFWQSLGVVGVSPGWLGAIGGPTAGGRKTARCVRVVVGSRRWESFVVPFYGGLGGWRGLKIWLIEDRDA